MVAHRQKGTLPIPVCLGLTDAGMRDRKEYKAYQVEAEAIHQEQYVTLLTPVKKEKGQQFLDAADQWLSRAISQVRQPIESLFNWINEKTGIQIASKVRSYQRLMVHVFGKLVAALFLMRLRVNSIV